MARFEVTTDFLVLCSDGELIPEVFAEKFTFRAEELFGAAVEEGDLPVAVDADDGVSGGFEHLAKLAGRGISKELGSFSIGDVVIVEGDTFVRGINRDIEPGIDALGVVLDTPLFPGPHGFAVEVFEIGTVDVGIYLPYCSSSFQVGGSDVATMAGLFICEGDVPISVNADNAFSDLGQQPGKALVPDVFLASAMADSLC